MFESPRGADDRAGRAAIMTTNTLISRRIILGGGCMSTIDSVLTENRTFPPPAAFVANANISGMAAYQALCDEAAHDFEGFWARQARSRLLWHKPFTQVLDETQAPFFKWFA